MTARSLPLALLSLVSAAGALACRPSEVLPPADPPPTADVAIGRTQDPAQQLAALSEQFLAAYFEASPVTATALGEHAHDHRWPDLSAAGQSDQDQWLVDQLEAVAAIPREGLDPDGRIELDTLRNQLELWRFASGSRPASTI